MFRIKLPVAAVASLAVTAGLLTACSSEDTSDTINVGFVAPLSSSPSAFQDPALAAKVAEKAVNDQGGINGKKLNVIVYDTKGQPANVVAGARKLVNEDNVVAFIGGNSNDGLAEIGKRAGVVNWFPMGCAAADVANELSMIAALNCAGAGQGTYLGGTRFKPRKAVYVAFAGNTPYIENAKLGYRNAGVDDVAVVEVPPETTDFAPIIAQVKAQNPDVWGGMIYTPEKLTSLIRAAIDQNLRIPLVLSNNVMEDATIELVSQSGIPNSVALEKGEDAEQFPTWKQYEEQLAKYDPEGEIKTPHDGSVTTDWLAVWTFAQEARKLDVVNADTFREHTTGLTDFQTDVLHPIDFTITDGPVLTAPRQANLWAFPGHIASGKIVVDSKEPYSAFMKTPVS
ncbi:ABC transporter substrate-binding protein [Gordonia terrae]|uniref:ABC transporter substrate-binding protein n=1 Tax=Gordonia terrae TaxID=2055 RepID=UPI00200AD263|nr:ABC transporter substrate-binding protein [Gordonia terrae]UPW09143.1 ABC transporter substrate-binding protein [Gordonia terrae]